MRVTVRYHAGTYLTGTHDGTRTVEAKDIADAIQTVRSWFRRLYPLTHPDTYRIVDVDPDPFAGLDE